MPGIEDKVVAITGASGGIGKAVARNLAARGARVVLAARTEASLAALAAEIDPSGERVAWRVTDVRRRADLQALVDLAEARFHGLDVLVSNAGVGPISRFDALAVDDWELMIDVNLKGVLHGVAVALPLFQRRGSGHFVHVVSTAGLKILPTMGVYAATKNAVRTLTEALRQEVGPAVRVTEVSPGLVATDFSQSISDPDLRHAIAERARIAIPPEAVARAIAFAIEQPAEVEIGSLVVRPAAQD